MLTLAEAQQLLTAAQQHAPMPMSFAVMDPAGHLLAFARMDGAAWITADVCQGKAWTAAAYATTSHEQKEKMLAMPNFATAITAMTHGRFTPQTGAVPIFRGGVLVGAIGGSGGPGELDEAACSAAVTAAGFSTEG